MLEEIWNEIQPTLLPLVVLAIGAIISVAQTVAAMAARRAEAWAEAKFGIELEEKHMRSLHSAIETGIRMAIERAAFAADLLPATAFEVALNHATASVPDAMDFLTPTKKVFEGIALAKLNKVMMEFSKRLK